MSSKSQTFGFSRMEACTLCHSWKQYCWKRLREIARKIDALSCRNGRIAVLQFRWPRLHFARGWSKYPAGIGYSQFFPVLGQEKLFAKRVAFDFWGEIRTDLTKMIKTKDVDKKKFRKERVKKFEFGFCSPICDWQRSTAFFIISSILLWESRWNDSMDLSDSCSDPNRCNYKIYLFRYRS